MTLDEIRARFSGFRLNITLEGSPGSPQVLVFSPKSPGDLDFAILQAKAVGMELVKTGKIEKFQGGIDVFKEATHAACKVFLKLNTTSNSEPSKPTPPSTDLSFLFYSSNPHLEKVVMEYFPNPGGVFIETQAGKGLEGSVSRFFDEFCGWSGFLLETCHYAELFDNRSAAIPATNTTPKKEVNCIYSNLVPSTQPCNNLEVHLKTLLSSYGISKVDWLHLKETGILLKMLLEDLKEVDVKPQLVTVDYTYPEGSLHDLASIMESSGYMLGRVYFNYGVFLKA